MKIRGDLADSGEQIVFVEIAQRRQSSGTKYGMMGERLRMLECAAAGLYSVDDSRRDYDCRYGRVAAAESFAERHDVRSDTIGFQGRPRSGATHAGEYFVGDEQHFVPVADFTDSTPVVRRRYRGASRRATDRLGDERRDRVRTFARDDGFERRGIRCATIRVRRRHAGDGDQPIAVQRLIVLAR